MSDDKTGLDDPHLQPSAKHPGRMQNLAILAMVIGMVGFVAFIWVYWIDASEEWEAAFLAGKCFAQYRRSGGTKRSPLPDFYIGAHAAVAGMTLLTRDARRYRKYFPKLRIVAP